MQNLSDFLIYIPLLPFFGFLILGLGQNRISRSGAGMIASCFAFLSFLLSLLVFIHQWNGFQDMLQAIPGWSSMLGRPHAPPLEQHIASWFNFAEPNSVAQARYGAQIGFQVGFDLAVDRLSSLMLLIVTGIGTLIHIYSIGYMEHDRSNSRFFAYMNLFLAMMLVLVMADNLVLMFVGWEGVGLCSYLLIGFWYEDPEKAKAGRKAFVVNRIGDLGFLLGIFIFVYLGGSSWLSFHSNGGPAAYVAGGHHEFLNLTRVDIANLPVWVSHFCLPGQAAPSPAYPYQGVQNLMLVGLICLFIGAIGKSAQIPLFVWLPDAMAGPTPVSALIHAATMVTAGVYMVLRLEPLYGAPWAESVRIIIATVGIVTALVAGWTAIVQNDIKKLLAYSTVSQLGYMMLGLGVGAFDAAFFHLLSHAFFKALLFLCAGSVIHAMSGEQDMRKMGGLKSKMKITYWTMVIGAAGLAGIPLFCGFFSKDEILYRSLQAGLTGNSLYTLYYLVGVATAAMTAFYSFRLIALTFHGPSRVAPEVAAHVHESRSTMTIPLMVLAAGTVLVGLLNLPANINSLFVSSEKGHGFYQEGLVSRYLMTDDAVWYSLHGKLASIVPGRATPKLSKAEQARLAAARAESATETGVVTEAELPNATTYEWGGMLFSGLVALLFAGLALKLYGPGPAWGEQMIRHGWVKPFYLPAVGKFYFDDVYDSLVVFVKVLSFLAWLLVDYILIDSLVVDGLGTLAHSIGENLRKLQTGVVNTYLLLMVLGAVGILCYIAVHLWMI
ncbi:MAG: NADH-quinone oxidoreductase subunit L [Planctomycetota bacterium]